LTTNGQGSATATGYGAYKGASGSNFNRKATTTVSKSGAVSHQGTVDATAKNGTSLDSSTSFSRTTPGNGTFDGNTKITGKNGNTYQGSTTWSKGAGYQHTGTCKSASGAVIPCKL